MLDAESWDRIARYAMGECTAPEAVETRAWIDQDAERKALADELVGLADSGPTAIWNARAAWERFSESIGEERPAGPVVRRPTSRPLFVGGGGSIGRTRRRWWVGVGAAAAVVLAVSWTLVWRSTHQRDGGVATPAPLRAVVTKRGQTADVYLGDGTRVTLGAASTLRFPAAFGAARDVYLDGEAYFDVVHDARRPFAVHTARAIARDIGTKFGVRAYAGGSATEVVVAEGAVALKAATALASPDSLVLTRAELGRLTPDGALTVTRRLDVDGYLAWMRGRLEFAGTPLSEALPQLSRWYDVDVRLGDSSLAQARLTASLEVESLPEALELLSAALDARVERQGRTVVLYPKRSTRTH